MLCPFLHLGQSNAVLDGLPINGDGELGRGTGCRLDWTGGTKFGDRMSDSLIQGVGVNLNGVQDSFWICERDATTSHTGIIACCSPYLRPAGVLNLQPRPAPKCDAEETSRRAFRLRISCKPLHTNDVLRLLIALHHGLSRSLEKITEPVACLDSCIAPSPVWLLG